MPDGQYHYVAGPWNVVNVVPGPRQENASHPWDSGCSIQATDLRQITDDLENRGQLVREEIRGGEAVLPPPTLNVPDLRFGLGGR